MIIIFLDGAKEKKNIFCQALQEIWSDCGLCGIFSFTFYEFQLVSRTDISKIKRKKKSDENIVHN